MRAAVFILLAAACGALCAEPRSTVVRCPACKGERSLSLTPPNLGQHDGEIGVTPGKPFANHRWDVKHARCPLCNGTGRQTTWVLKARPPEDRADKEPCTTCWWSGVEPCRRCDHTGYVDCPDARHGTRRSPARPAPRAAGSGKRAAPHAMEWAGSHVNAARAWVTRRRR